MPLLHGWIRRVEKVEALNLEICSPKWKL